MTAQMQADCVSFVALLTSIRVKQPFFEGVGSVLSDSLLLKSELRSRRRVHGFSRGAKRRG